MIRLSKEIAIFTRNANPNLPIRPVDFNPEFVHSMVQSELKELMEAETLVERVDALADIIVYCVDTAIRHGIDLDSVLDEVHRANMMKIRNPETGEIKVIRDEDPNSKSYGKILKPEGFIAANVGKVVLAQQTDGVVVGGAIDFTDETGGTGIVVDIVEDPENGQVLYRVIDANEEVWLAEPGDIKVNLDLEKKVLNAGIAAEELGDDALPDNG